MTTKSIKKNFLFKFSLEILRIIIPIISIPYVYRIFNPQIMGNIEFSQSISGYFFIFAGFGVYTYGLREVSRIRNDKEKRNKVFSELFFISTLSTVVIFFVYVLYVFFNVKSDLILKNMLLINSIQIIAYIFYLEWINEAFENYKFIAQKTIIIKILNVICIFLFIKVVSDFYKYLLMINIFILLNNLISFFYIKRYMTFTFKELEIKKYLFPLLVILLINNINILYTQLDKIFLGYFTVSREEIAYYGIGQKIMTIIMVLIMSLINVSKPRLSFYLGENQEKEYFKLLEKLFTYMFILLFPMGIGIVILSREMCLFFGGENYLAANLVVIVFGIRMIEVSVESLLSNQILFLYRKEKVIALIYGICGIFNFLMKFILIKEWLGIKFNAETAILTTMFAEILIIILSILYIKKYLKLEIIIFKWIYLKYFIFSLSFFGIKYLFKNIEINYFLHSILVFIVCSITYIFLLFLSKDKYLFEILYKIKIVREIGEGK